LIALKLEYNQSSLLSRQDTYDCAFLISATAFGCIIIIIIILKLQTTTGSLAIDKLYHPHHHPHHHSAIDCRQQQALLAIDKEEALGSSSCKSKTPTKQKKTENLLHPHKHHLLH
jgi:hypothetical protein